MSMQTLDEQLLRIVYMGPWLCGKATNTQYIIAGTPPEANPSTRPLCGHEFSAETGCTGKRCRHERCPGLVLRFTFSPPGLPLLNGHRVRLSLSSVVGCLYQPPARRPLLAEADGIVLVVDSQLERKEANELVLLSMREELELQGRSLDSIPFAIQYNLGDQAKLPMDKKLGEQAKRPINKNKRELPNAKPVEELRRTLNPEYPRGPDFEAIARQSNAPGVFETLKCVVKIVLMVRKETGNSK